MRGKEVQGLLQDLVGGITPAYAGKSRTLSGLRFWKRDHPRVCGEKHDVMYDPDRDRGSPPRVRGKASGSWKCFCAMGITPACAGKRTQYFPACSCIWDHPRVCGEKSFGDVVALDAIGSPPRVRGKELDFLPGFFGDRITPACAGKSAKAVTIEAIQKDHPRVCGEKPRFCGQADLVRGSPPRVRGKGWRTVAEALMIGITPACAGKSRLQGSNLQLPGDHPRVCGEKTAIHLSAASSSGSPPRVRGKADKTKLEKVWGGITPACAGKSDIRNSSLKKLLGSPPRVRGKVKTPQKGLQRPRITPACAGKRKNPKLPG